MTDSTTADSSPSSSPASVSAGPIAASTQAPQLQAPGVRGGAEVGQDWRPALSASRAKEYQRCPLQYRLHVVDRMKEPPTQATARGTLVHSVLENLYDAPAAERTREAAQDLVIPLWEAMKENNDEVADLFPTTAEFSEWMAQTRDMVDHYFRIEDPRWLEPHGRESHVVAETPEGVRLRGFIDRIDRAPNGALRVVDYKTGRAPSTRFQEDALFQMRFYALLLQLTDRLPARTQLLYLKSGQVLTFDPEAADIERFRFEIARLWDAIEADARRGTFAPRKNPLCNWCGVRTACPLFGGTPPPLPEEGIEKLLQTRASYPRAPMSSGCDVAKIDALS